MNINSAFRPADCRNIRQNRKKVALVGTFQHQGDTPTLNASAGFTLMEILIVLAIIGLLASITMPNMQKLSASLEISTKKSSLRSELGQLSYRAYVNGESFELSNATISNKLADSQEILKIPSGWQIKISRPVQFSFNGICTGGSILITDSDGVTESVQLPPPSCKPSYE